MKPEDRIIIALDVETYEEAEKIVEATTPPATYFKIGSIPFTVMGHRGIEMVKKHGGKVFLDLKWHDIPNTVAGAVSAAVALGVDMVNVHAAGGKEMMKAAKTAAADTAKRLNVKPPLVIAVTVLTSFDDASYKEATCSSKSIKEQVPYLAQLAKESGLDGVVASPEEVPLIRSVVGKDFIIVTPGIRPSWSVKGDQKRVTTPADAIRLGSDYMVIGRPICAAENPKEAFGKVLDEIRTAK
jgi:orotidine-5'-phosphate decarboxylase